MKFVTKLIASLAVSLTAIVPLSAQAARETGWEFGIDGIYLVEQDVGFEGGTQVTLDDDYSIALNFGYRLNERFEIHFALDWNEVDYRATVRSNNPLVNGNISGTIESFIPRIDATFNLFKGPFTPYVTASAGWAFIDTNIPTSLPQTVCWWDPWYGYICDTYQETATSDEFVYGAGAGIRMDVGDSVSFRLAYHKQFMDLGKSTSEAGLDQIRLGIAFRY